MIDKFSSGAATGFAAAFKTGRILLFLLFLGFFVASHTITALAAITSTAISAVAGTTSTVLGRTQGTADDLIRQNARLKADLDLERGKARKLVAENARLRKSDAITFRGRSTSVKAASREVLGRTMKRTRTSAMANLASIPGEGIPFYGIAIVLAATTYELKTACDNMIDLYDLQVAIDPDAALPDDKAAVCALEIPSRDEVWASIKSSPRHVWESTVKQFQTESGMSEPIERPESDGFWDFGFFR